MEDEDKLNEIMMMLDPSGSGKVSFEEFLAGYEKHGMEALLGDMDDVDDFDLEDGDLGAKGSVSKDRPRRGSLAEAMRIEQFSGGKNVAGSPGKRRDSLANFEHSKTTQKHEERISKIINFCDDDSTSTVISVSELETSMKFLARAFNEAEAASLREMLQGHGFANIKAGTVKFVLTEVQKNITEWDEDAFVKDFLATMSTRLNEDPKAGVAEQTPEDKIAELEATIRQFEKRDAGSQQKYRKIVGLMNQLDKDNRELMKQAGLDKAGIAGKAAREEAREKDLAAQRNLVDTMQTEMTKTNSDFKKLRKEHQNTLAVLQVERKIKKSVTSDLAVLKETMEALKTSRTAHNRLALKKKLGKMKAVQEKRKYARGLQVRIERVAQLESENKLLKQTIERMKAEQLEYLRLMDSSMNDRQGIPVDLGQAAPANNMNMVFKDESELEELRKKLAKALQDLAEERELREALERELVAVKHELEETKDKLIEETMRRERAEEAVERLTKELTAANLRIEDLEARLADLEAKYKAALEEIAALKAERDALLKRVAELEALVDELRAKIKALEDLIASMEGDLMAKLAELTKLVEELRRRIKELEAENAALKARVAELEALLAAKEAELAEALKRIGELEEANAKLLAEVEDLKRLLAESEAERKRLQAILDEHELEIVTIVEEKVFVAPDMNAIAIGQETGPSLPQIKLTDEQQAELTAYTICFNNHLSKDPDLKHHMTPIINPDSTDLLFKVSDGLLIAKFINQAVPDTIDERALNVPKDGGSLEHDDVVENLNLAISAAKSVGVTVQPTDSSTTLQLQLMECTDPQLTLDFLYGLVKCRYSREADVRKNPELIDICETPDEGLSSHRLPEIEPDDLKRLSPEDLVMRWTNYHMLAGASEQLAGGLIKNWDQCADAHAFVNTLGRIAEAKGQPNAPDGSRTDLKRARFCLDKAKALGVNHFHRPNNVASGSKRLNFLFAATLLDHHTGFSDDGDLMASRKKKAGVDPNTQAGSGMSSDSREERAFRMWINSLGIPGVYLNNLFLDCRDGLALLRVEDYTAPGCVTWKKVEMKPTNKFKAVGNCNYAVEVGKSAPLLLKLVAIGGEDIHSGHDKLILGLVWQLMRFYVLDQLKKLQSGSGGDLSDDAILKWANGLVASNVHPSRKSDGMDTMKSMKDKRLSNSRFLVNLIWAINPGVVNWDMVSAGNTEVEKVRNAGYTLSIARKLGADVFLLPHDIVEVKPKMMLLFIGSLMAQSSS